MLNRHFAGSDWHRKASLALTLSLRHTDPAASMADKSAGKKLVIPLQKKEAKEIRFDDLGGRCALRSPFREDSEHPTTETAEPKKDAYELH